VGKKDINRRLLPHRELDPVPKYNPKEHYIKIKGPTMTMLAILCEQDEILKFILENKQPDLSICVEGYQAHHLAAMTKDYRCLQLLIQYEWVQQNIDSRVELTGLTAQPGWETTALHCAVSNRRIHNIFLLICEFPEWKVLPEAKQFRPGKPGTAPAATEDAPADTASVQRCTYQAAHIDKKSASGSTPLYIAIYLQDVKMVHILLSAGADVSIAAKNGKTCEQLANELRQQAQERRAAREQREDGKDKKKQRRKKEEDPIETICKLLADTDKLENIADLKERFAPELVPHEAAVPSDDDNESDAEEEDEDQPDPKDRQKPVVPKLAALQVAEEGGKKKKGQGKKKDLLQKMCACIQQIGERLEHLEQRFAGGQPGVRSAVSPAAVSSFSVPQCKNCSGTPVGQCSTCHENYCTRCMDKGEIHKCSGTAD
jgi:hypothetical protein